jgi:hypothetical protein
MLGLVKFQMHIYYVSSVPFFVVYSAGNEIHAGFMIPISSIPRFLTEVLNCQFLLNHLL